MTPKQYQHTLANNRRRLGVLRRAAALERSPLDAALDGLISDLSRSDAAAAVWRRRGEPLLPAAMRGLVAFAGFSSGELRLIYHHPAAHAELRRRARELLLTLRLDLPALRSLRFLHWDTVGGTGVSPVPATCHLSPSPGGTGVSPVPSAPSRVRAAHRRSLHE